MHWDRRLFSGLVLASAVACFAATGCSDVTPESNDTGGGVLESPTHETQQEQQQQEQQMENRQMGGGGGARR